ncbi:MAG: large conductance mechanosensitive channel protein MscL [Burkholderiales bacterium]|jgi:large conductance mechanosensitive channel|nr:large conductance mechanosensitive channel protein MscL [Polynucleobacter sp.]MCX7252938.1 large conductance mechanosensitive channel protein MscL [Burkholderiales bacterium]NBY63313.1 large conductance mechanosensitive channel protein MscL [Betaproteobacteria bacterium]
MSRFADFKAFAMRGNVMDLAIGVIIGGAFGKIVDSVVSDIIMPLITVITGGGIDFTNLFIVLGKVPEGTIRNFDTLKKLGIPMFAYGNFITILINFVILAFIIYQLVKIINTLRSAAEDEQEAAPPPTSEEILLLREIRDSLKSK